MSIEKNVQTVQDFFGAMGRGDKGCWRCLPKILSGSFREGTGHWPERIAGTRD
jgi:hypothetical protein